MSDIDENSDLPKFYPPVRDLKYKVGQGGLSKDVIRKAQKVIDINDVNFLDLAKPYMSVLEDGVARAKAIRRVNKRN